MFFCTAAFLAAAAACAPTRRLPTPPLVAVRAGRHAAGSPRDDLVLCPTPGCNTPLKPGKVAGHLFKCPVLAEQRALEASGYYRRAVNSGDRLDDEEHDGSGEASSALTPELEARLMAAHATECGSRLLHTPATPALLADEDGGGAKARANERERERQRLQGRAIAEQLAALDLLGHGHCLVELGAGNGELSLAIAEAYPEEVRSDALILLDRASKPKGKSKGGRLAADPRLAEAFGSMHRVKLSLEDVQLDGLRDAFAPGRRTVVVAKHLCGAASDYALRALAAACAAAHPPLGIVLGTCCHHRCAWEAYPARDFLRRSAAVGRSRSEFGALCRLSSRGVQAADLSARADTGRRAKDLLDEGRVRFLREHAGFEDARLVTYVDGAVTPENVLIVASRGEV